MILEWFTPRLLHQTPQILHLQLKGNLKSNLTDDHLLKSVQTH